MAPLITKRAGERVHNGSHFSKSPENQDVARIAMREMKLTYMKKKQLSTFYN
jgi:hypothetical protein